MEGTTTDRRVRRTKARLRQALAQLLLEKDLSSITVRELTDLADVNRGTFYTHYRDLYDMLEQMEQEMFQELEDMLDSYASDILQQDITPILRDVFRFVGRNKDLCQVFLARQVGLIRAWLERGAQESPEEMAQLTGQLILSGVYSQAH